MPRGPSPIAISVSRSFPQRGAGYVMRAARTTRSSTHDLDHPQLRVAHRHRLRGAVRAVGARAARVHLHLGRGLHGPADGGGDRSRGARARGAVPHRGDAGLARSRRRAACAQPRELVDLSACQSGVPTSRGQSEQLARSRTGHGPLGRVQTLRRGRRRPLRDAPCAGPALSASRWVPPPRRTQHAGFRGDALGHLPYRGMGHRHRRGPCALGCVAVAKERGGAHRVHQPDVTPDHGRRAVRAYRESRERRRIRRAGREPERDARAHRDPDGRRAQGLGQRRARSAHPARPLAHPSRAAS